MSYTAQGLARISISALLALAGSCVAAPAAKGAFGVEERNFEAGTCFSSACTYASPPSAFFTQAAGHPPVGITTFEFNHRKGLLGEEPEGNVKNIRVDIPRGLAANPEALPKCPIAAFERNACQPDTQVGTNELTLYDGVNLTISGTVYNLEQPQGLPLDFGIDVSVEPLVNVHIYLEGHVSWSSDYHEYFEINNVPKEGVLLGARVPLSVLKSKLIFNGRAGAGNFLTLPSECSSTTTSYLEVESWEGQLSRTQTHTPFGVEGCDRVPFGPIAEIEPETAQSDQPDGVAGELRVPQYAGSEEVNTADVKDAHVTLPEGMTLDPSAAHGLESCTAAEIGIGTSAPVTCPAASRVGTVTIETDLPPGSLAGNVYLGDPGGGAITGPPYTIYVDAESPYGVSVRLRGTVNPDPTTGRLEATFAGNPELPFSDLVVKLDGGALAPLANPLSCGIEQLQASFTPYSGEAAALSSSPFVTALCASSPPPFALAQSTSSQSPAAGGPTSYTFNLGRADGEQYLQRVTSTLPAGLVGAIPSVPLCGEPQAAQGTCSAASEIGTATVAAGAGPMPYSFSGPVYLTGPYGRAPYGLSVVVPAIAGPFDLGTVVTRAAINVGLYSGRVIATSVLPTIVGGIPLRLKSVSVAVNRSNFLINPTNCGALATESTLTSTFAALQSLSSPFQVSGCSSLAFKPAFSVMTSAKASKAKGASFEVKIRQGAHQANIREVLLTLPKQLPARLTTLQKACPAAMFEASEPPGACPSTARVGTATVRTPVLPSLLSGPAYLVSHGGAAFPDLDLVLRGDGVEVVLVGHTHISASGVVSSKFEALPDVPISSATVDLPMGPRSLLSANGALCRTALIAPTTIVAQSGARIRRRTKITPRRCPVRITAHRTTATAAIVTVLVPAAGRLSARGRYLRSLVRHVRRATSVRLRVPLTSTGVSAARSSRRLKLRLRVGFVPHARREASSASTMLSFHG
jgi:hypothetical protein